MNHRKIDLGSTIVLAIAVTTVFVLVDGILVERLNLPHTLSTVLLAIITVVFLLNIRKKETEYYEDMLKTSFDDETIKKAKWLKERKDERDISNRM